MQPGDLDDECRPGRPAVAGLLSIAAKRGKVVITNIHPWTEVDVKANLFELTLWEKQIIGSIFGSANPRYDLPQLARLYREGQLDLDGLVTKTYSLDELNQATKTCVMARTSAASSSPTDRNSP